MVIYLSDVILSEDSTGIAHIISNILDRGEEIIKGYIKWLIKSWQNIGLLRLGEKGQGLSLG